MTLKLTTSFIKLCQSRTSLTHVLNAFLSTNKQHTNKLKMWKETEKSLFPLTSQSSILNSERMFNESILNLRTFTPHTEALDYLQYIIKPQMSRKQFVKLAFYGNIFMLPAAPSPLTFTSPQHPFLSSLVSLPGLLFSHPPLLHPVHPHTADCLHLFMKEKFSGFLIPFKLSLH